MFETLIQYKPVLVYDEKTKELQLQFETQPEAVISFDNIIKLEDK